MTDPCVQPDERRVDAFEGELRTLLSGPKVEAPGFALITGSARDDIGGCDLAGRLGLPRIVCVHVLEGGLDDAAILHSRVRSHPNPDEHRVAVDGEVFVRTGPARTVGRG